MRSIKPGRGPSAMGAVGSVFIGLFGVIWTIGAASMGAPIFFVFFGIVFVGLAVVQGIYHFKNATGRNRMSVYDITSNLEEPDPFDKYVKRETGSDITDSAIKYCPYCGEKVIEENYKYCPKCGKEIGN